MKSSPHVMPRPKQPYAPPRLISYGQFKDIVQGRGGVKQEPGGPQVGARSRA